MKRSVVIPVWNGRDLLSKLLSSIENQSLRFDEIIVVDNGSTDGAGRLAEQHGARVVRFAENRGFCVAVNRGMQEAAGDLIAVINVDVELSPEWACHLARSLEADQVWFATGLLLCAREPSKIDGTWDLVSKATMPWRAGSGAPANHPAYGRPRTTDLASFTAILLRRELWARVGELDSQFETYLEDVDFGLRCAAAGLQGAYQPCAVAWHQGSATLGRWNSQSVRLMSRNQLILVRKHLPPYLQRRWWWKLLCGQSLWGWVAFRHGAGWAWLLGKWDGLRLARSIQPASLQPSMQFFEAQERQILELQRQTGFDTYWRFYRLLTAADEAK